MGRVKVGVPFQFTVLGRRSGHSQVYSRTRLRESSQRCCRGFLEGYYGATTGLLRGYYGATMGLL